MVKKMSMNIPHIAKQISEVVDAILPGVIRFVVVEPAQAIIKDVVLLVDEENRHLITPENLAQMKNEVWKKIGFLPLFSIGEFEPELCRR